jgi:hypothetical protein
MTLVAARVVQSEPLVETARKKSAAIDIGRTMPGPLTVHPWATVLLRRELSGQQLQR